MPISSSPRFGFSIWGVDTDVVQRSQFVNDLESIESLSGIYTEGLLSGRPAAGVGQRFYYATDTDQLFFDTGATGWRLTDIPLPTAGTPGVARFRGFTVLGPPTSGTYATNDYVIDLTGTVFFCVTGGGGGVWGFPVGGILGNGTLGNGGNTGPNATTDFSTFTSPVLALNPSLVLGEVYELKMSANGQQITNPSASIQISVTDSRGWIPGGTLRVAGEIAHVGAGLGLLGGSESCLIIPTSTAQDIITLSVFSAAAAFRIQAHAIKMSITRVA